MADTPPPNSEGPPEGTPEGVPEQTRAILPRPRQQLTHRQQLFITHYLNLGNATQAAIRAGYSVKNADKIGSELLGKTRISDAIREKLSAQLVQIEATAEKTLRETAILAYSSIADYSLGTDGVLRLASNGVDPASIRAVQHYKRKERVLRRVKREDGEPMELVEIETEIKLHDKNRALTNLFQYHGLLKQPTPAAHDDPVKELLKRLPPEVAAALSAVLATTSPATLAPGNGGPDPEPNGSGDDGSSGVPAVSE